MAFSILYSLFYSPLLWLLSIFKIFNSKLKRGFKLRKKIKGIKPWLNFPEKSQPIWIHCASGEYEYAKPVIRLIKQNDPQQKVLVTFFSPSVEPSLAQASDIDFYCPTPWDTGREWQSFIDHHQPKSLLIARTDLWPMMIRTAQKNKIPRLLFSKTVNKEKSGLQNIVSHSLMKKMSDIFCVSEEDRQALFKSIKPYDKIHDAGDTRYDQCFYRMQHSKKLKPLNNFHKPLFIAGSTWPGDERILLPLLCDKIKEVAFVIAPHEPSKKHLSQLIALLDHAGLEHQLYSATSSWNPDAVLIIDQVGILADLYAWGDFSYIGGSTDRSVHSVMESLAHGLLTFIGTQHSNNREALLFKTSKIKDMTPVQVIEDYDELIRRFQALHRSWTDGHKLDLKLAVKNKSGASEITFKWLQKNQKDWTNG